MKMLFLVSMAAMAATAGMKHPSQDPARVEAIAAHLPEKAGTVGPLPSDRSAWEGFAADQGAKEIIRQAAKRVGEPMVEAPEAMYLEFAKVDGNRSRYEARYFKRRQNLDLFMLAEVLEWKGRFIGEIRRYLEAMLQEKSWTVPAHDRRLDCFEGRKCIVALFSSQRCWTIAYAIAWFGDQLGPELVARARAECLRRILNPYLAACRDQRKLRDCDAGGWFFGRANWTAVCHLNCTAAALMLVEDRRTRAEFLEACERAMPCFFSGFTSDGYCSEGMGYWGYGFGCYTSLALLARHYTGGFVKLLSDTPKAACVARYATGYQLEEGISPRFADGGGNPPPFQLAEASLLWPASVPEKYTHLPLFSGSMSNFGRFTSCCAVDRRAFGFKGIPGTSPVADLPVRTVFPEAQVFLMRPAAKGGIAVALKGGNNGEFHNHNDVGTYAASVNGVYLLGDVGAEAYTARTFSPKRYVSNVLNSFGHAVPRVDGALQMTGGKFAGRVLATDFSETRDLVKLDLKGAYECPKLVKLERTLVYDRVKGSFTIGDEVEFSAPASLDVPFVAPVACRREGEKWILGGKKAAIEVAVQVAGGDWTWVSDDLDNGGRTKEKLERHSVSFTAPVTRATVQYTFTPAR